MMRVCNVTGCPNITNTPRCPTHTKAAQQARGDRGYTTKGHQAFRAAVLNRDPICVICHTQQSTVADHHPRSRKQLLALNMNANNPSFGRGLCATCHNKETAQHQPGGWNNRPG